MTYPWARGTRPRLWRYRSDNRNSAKRGDFSYEVDFEEIGTGMELQLLNGRTIGDDRAQDELQLEPRLPGFERQPND